MASVRLKQQKRSPLKLTQYGQLEKQTEIKASGGPSIELAAYYLKPVEEAPEPYIEALQQSRQVLSGAIEGQAKMVAALEVGTSSHSTLLREKLLI